MKRLHRISAEDLNQSLQKIENSLSSISSTAGIILHPTSLPGPYGIGEIGKETLRFLDWLESSGCMVLCPWHPETASQPVQPIFHHASPKL